MNLVNIIYLRVLTSQTATLHVFYSPYINYMLENEVFTFDNVMVT